MQQDLNVSAVADFAITTLKLTITTSSTNRSKWPFVRLTVRPSFEKPTYDKGERNSMSIIRFFFFSSFFLFSPIVCRASKTEF